MTNEEVVQKFEAECPDDYQLYSFERGKMITKTEILEEMKYKTPHGECLIEIFKIGFETSKKLYKAKP